MRLILGIIVLVVLVGGIFWFMSDSSTSVDTNTESTEDYSGVTESSSIDSDEEVLRELDNALEDLE